MKIRLPIQLTPKQQQIEASPARFKTLKAGRRGGKTEYLSFWLGKRGLSVPGKHWYVCQSLDLIRDEMWPRLCTLLADYIQHKDDRLFRMRISNGHFDSLISCKSLQKEDVHRGRGIHSLAGDECILWRPHVYDTILRPMLADHRAPAVLASSAKKGWFTRLHEYATSSGDKDWAGFKFTIYDNPHISRDEIEAIKKSTPPDVWEQEYMANEQENQGQVYTELDDSSIYEHGSRFGLIRSRPCVVGMDWGTSANAAAIWVHVSPEGYVVVDHEHVRNNWDPGKHASVIRTHSSRLSGNVKEYVLDRSAFRNESDGDSVADQFRRSGIYCLRSEKDIDSSVNHVKQFMRGSGGTPWLYISDDCPMLLAGLRDWEWGDHEPDAVVALRYAIARIVKTGLSPLANKFPDYVHKDDPDALTDIDEMAARIGKVKVPMTRQAKSSWTWDSEYGGFR